PSNPRSKNCEPDVPFGVPFAPSPYSVRFRVKGNSGIAITRDVPVTFRYVRDIYNGDKRMELNVVPAFSVKTTPSLAVVPAPSGAPRAPSLDREIHVTVTNGTKGAAQATVTLEAPAGWKVAP